MKRRVKVNHARSVPVRSHIPLGLPSTSDVDGWLNSGQTEHLEKILLDGYKSMLNNRNCGNTKSRLFMEDFQEYTAKITKYLSAITEGNLEEVRALCEYKRVVKARRPQTGACGLHLAVISKQFHIVSYLATNFPFLREFVDNDNRLPLHYMAALVHETFGMQGNKRLTAENPDVQFSLMKNIYGILGGSSRLEEVLDIDGVTPVQYLQGNHTLHMEELRKRTGDKQAVCDEIVEWIRTADYVRLKGIILDGHNRRVLGYYFPPGREELKRKLEICARRVQAIHRAVADGDEDSLKHLLDRKEFALARDSSGSTPLHTAVRHEKVSIVDYLLLVHPHCVNAVDQERRTALHYACALDSPNKTVLKDRLIKAGVDSTLVDTHGLTPEEYTSLVKLEKSNSVNGSIFGIISVSDMADQIMSDTMSSGGAMSDCSSPEPMHGEIQKWLDDGDFGRLEEMVVRGKSHLLDRYAEHYQVVANFLDSMQKNQAKVEKIHEAIREGSLRKVKNLADRKKLILTRSVEGQNSLGLAVVLGQKHIVDYFVAAYPDCINLKDKDKRTALHYAAVLADQSLYDTLLVNGADEHVQDKNGYTPKEYKDNPKAMMSESETVMSAAALAEQERFFQEMDAATAPTAEQIDQWLSDGNVDELEQIILNGRSHLLMGRTSENATTEEFLLALPRYQAKVDAIHKAVEDGDVRRVKSLIDRPSLAMARDRKGATPIHNAVLHGQTDTLKYLLSKFPEAVNATDHVGRSPLHYAAADRNGAVYVKMLQKAGADAFVVDKLGHSPFYYRTNPEHLNLIKLKDDAVMDQLLSGEVPNTLLQDLEEEIAEWLHTRNMGKLEELVLNGYGDLLLGKAHEVEDKDVLSFLEVLPQYQAKIQALHRAIENDSLREVKALMDRKKLSVARDRKGLTPLHKAVLYGHLDIISWLLKNYPQAVNALDHSKRTPLHFAAALCPQDAGYSYKLLRKAGADPNIPDCEGKSPKHYLNFPQEMCIDLLREECKAVARAVLQQRVAPSYLETSIQQWLREGNVGKLEQLTLSGCGDLLLGRIATDPKAAEFLSTLDEIMTKINEMHRSVREGDIRALKDHLNKKKLVVARDRKGATPLHDAILYQQTEIVRYLAQSFPQTLNAPDYNKRTPLHYAAACRDGGHYFKILEKAGADPSAVDNEGKTPDVYRRNPGILDLRVILERDRDFVPDISIVRSGSPVSMARTDSRGSDFSALTPVSTARDGMAVAELLIDIPMEHGLLSAISDAVASPTARGQWLRRMPPTSANGKYLASAVGTPLTKALAEVIVRRPADPIAFLSEWLYNYHKLQEKRMNTDNEYILK